eukprot:6015600-Lingulodinium_polyedra.AAC.1
MARRRRSRSFSLAPTQIIVRPNSGRTEAARPQSVPRAMVGVLDVRRSRFTLEMVRVWREGQPYQSQCGMWLQDWHGRKAH